MNPIVLDVNNIRNTINPACVTLLNLIMYFVHMRNTCPKRQEIKGLPWNKFLKVHILRKQSVTAVLCFIQHLTFLCFSIVCVCSETRLFYAFTLFFYLPSCLSFSVSPLWAELIRIILPVIPRDCHLFLQPGQSSALAMAARQYPCPFSALLPAVWRGIGWGHILRENPKVLTSIAVIETQISASFHAILFKVQ